MLKKIFIVFILGIINLCAQSSSISGTVKDSAGNSLPGVNVMVDGTNLGTATDADGRFVIKKIKPGRYEIEFSSIGYGTKKINIEVLSGETFAASVVLQVQPLVTDAVVTSASKYGQKISSLPVSAEVIGADALEKKDISNLEDAMRYVPGVNIVDDQISIRGSSGYSRGAGTRVMLTLDGIPFYTGDNGDIIWESIPVTDIQKVEIIKGAASSLYGSSAIGGVVNVVTKEIPSGPVTFIKTGAGFYDKPAYSIWDWSSELRTNSNLTVSHSDKIGGLGYILSLSRLSDMSYEQSNFYTRYIGYFKGMYNFSAASSLTFFANSLNQHTGNYFYWKDSRNALVPPDADQGQSVTSGRYMLGAIYKDIVDDNLFLNLRGSYYRTNWIDDTPAHDSSTSNLFRIEIQANKSFTDGLILVSGVEATHDNVNSNIFSNHDAYGFGLYSQAEYKPELRNGINGKPLTTVLGVRYDFNKTNSQSGVSALSPKAGVNYQLSDKLILRSSFGTGFRAPTLSEVYTSTSESGITVKPNPSLKPEKNWTLEAGANYQAYASASGVLNYIDFDAALFQNEFYDFIEPSVDPADGLISFRNVTRARIQGAEVNSSYNFFNNKLLLSLNYTYLWARDLQLNQALKYRPRNMAWASIEYSISDFVLGADFRYSSKVEEMDFELVNLGVVKDGTRRAEVKVFDLRAEYNLILLGTHTKLLLNVNNVLNYNYVELLANLAPIRNYSLSAEFLF